MYAQFTEKKMHPKMSSFLCIITKRARKKIIGYQSIPDYCREREIGNPRWETDANTFKIDRERCEGILTLWLICIRTKWAILQECPDVFKFRLTDSLGNVLLGKS